MLILDRVFNSRFRALRIANRKFRIKNLDRHLSQLEVENVTEIFQSYPLFLKTFTQPSSYPCSSDAKYIQRRPFAWHSVWSQSFFKPVPTFIALKTSFTVIDPHNSLDLHWGRCHSEGIDPYFQTLKAENLYCSQDRLWRVRWQVLSEWRLRRFKYRAHHKWKQFC